MNSHKIIQLLKKTLLFLAGAALLVWGHYSNDRLKESKGIDVPTGATELAE